MTSLRPQHASPKLLLKLWRGHWGIENRLHWVRDVVFDEDRCQVRSGAAPQALAAIRNMAIGLLRFAGFSNIAAAQRRHAAHYREAIALLEASLIGCGCRRYMTATEIGAVGYYFRQRAAMQHSRICGSGEGHGSLAVHGSYAIQSHRP